MKTYHTKVKQTENLWMIRELILLVLHCLRFKVYLSISGLHSKSVFLRCPVRPLRDTAGHRWSKCLTGA